RRDELDDFDLGGAELLAQTEDKEVQDGFAGAVVGGARKGLNARPEVVLRFQEGVSMIQRSGHRDAGRHGGPTK
ncbi:hypothetical protein MMC11_008895, partial [Xylographa trunciseda]|nr:hypothetical protein [Xylographa trunciseda]